MPDDATVEILLRVREQGAAAFAEASLLARNFREAVDSLNRATAEGVPITEAARRAIGELTRGLIESDLSARDQAAQIKDTRQALTRYIEVVSAGMAPMDAYNAVLAFQTAEMGANATATRAATGAAFGGIPVWAAWAAGIGIALAVLFPFVTLIGSAVVALTSFLVAGAGMAALFGLVAGAFGAIGAGVLLLGGGGGIGAAAALQTATTQLQTAQTALSNFNQLHTGSLTLAQQQQKAGLTDRLAAAQAKYNDALAASQGPTGVLIAQLTQMKDALAAQAEPLARMITQWVGGAIPAVQALGSSIMTWFGQRLPGVLAGISKIVKDLTPDFDALGKHFGQVMDHVGPQMVPITEAFIRLGIQGANGLLNNLVRLSDWFIKELPTLGPIVQQIFGALGNMIQAVASHWGDLTNFVENNWGTTVKNAQSSLQSLNTWWQTNGSTIKTFAGNIVTLMGYFNQIIGLWTQIYGFLNAVGLSPTKLLDALNEIAGIFERIWGFVANITGQSPHVPGTSNPGSPSQAAAQAAQASRHHNSNQPGSKVVVQVSLAPGLIGKALRPQYQV